MIHFELIKEKCIRSVSTVVTTSDLEQLMTE